MSTHRRRTPFGNAWSHPRLWLFPLAALALLLASATAADAARAKPRATVKKSATADRLAPKPPSNLRATAATGTSVTIAWTASRDNVGVAGYGSYLNGRRIATTTATSFKFGQLACGRTYKFGVDAFDAAKNRSSVSSVLAATAPCVDTTAPTAPASLRQTNETRTGVLLEWGAASDDVGVAGYSVYRDGVPVSVTQQTSLWLGGLVCGAGYAIAVEAFDAAGNRSPTRTAFARTQGCADTSPPTAPGDLQVSASTAGSVSVSWHPSSDDRGVAAYRLFLNNALTGTTTATSATVSGLSCGASHTVAVSAIDAAGNESPAASVAAATTPCPAPPSAPPSPGPGDSDTQPPSVPTGLTKTAATPLSASLSWNASSDDVGVASYGVYRNGSKVAEAKGTAYVVESLTCATSYTIAVDAVDAAGNRSAKASLLASTAACAASRPSPPTGLTQAGSTETSLTLSWQPAAGSDVVGYRVLRDGSQVGTTATLSFVFTGLACGTSYTLGVEAFDGAGNHSTREATILSTSGCSDAVAPTAPTALTKTGASPTSVSMSWGASTDNVGVAGYALYVGGTAIGTTAQTTYAFSALTCGTSYLIGVEAYDAAGNRSSRVSLNAFTAACAESPPPPAPAGSIYVSPAGADTNPCTQAQPCRSFGRAYKAAPSGATVLVAAGTYGSQEISLDPAKGSGAPVVFQPWGGSVSVNGTIDFGQDQFDRLGPENVTVRDMKVTYLRSWRGSKGLLWENIDGTHFDIFDSTNVTVRGGDFGPCQAPRDDPACVNRIAGTSNGVVVENTNIHDVTSTDLVNYHVDGMFVRGGKNIVIRNSKFWGNMITNIRVQEQACCKNDNLLIENNWFNAPLQGDGVTPRSDAINVDTPVVNGVTIQFNSFAENASPQVVAPALVKGNLMQNMSCAAGVTYAYNLFVPFSPYTGQSPCGATDKKVLSFGYLASSLAGGFDYAVALGTAGIDYVPTSAGCPAADIKGVPRPQGGACDVGAGER